MKSKLFGTLAATLVMTAVIAAEYNVFVTAVTGIVGVALGMLAIRLEDLEEGLA